MTVKNLVKLLSGCDQDAEVEISFCYNRSRVPGDCVSLTGSNVIIVRDPMERKVEICSSNHLNR